MTHHIISYDISCDFGISHDIPLRHVIDQTICHMIYHRWYDIPYDIAYYMVYPVIYRVIYYIYDILYHSSSEMSYHVI